MPALDFGQDICNDLGSAAAREGLVTNGMGSFAAGTVASLLTRRYHGLLAAALDPPLDRHLLVGKFNETATYSENFDDEPLSRPADASPRPGAWPNFCVPGRPRKPAH